MISMGAALTINGIYSLTRINDWLLSVTAKIEVENSELMKINTMKMFFFLDINIFHDPTFLDQAIRVIH